MHMLLYNVYYAHMCNHCISLPSANYEFLHYSYKCLGPFEHFNFLITSLGHG